MLIFAAFAIALFFAMNIGASGTAAAMGPAYGSGAISKRLALFLVAIFVFLGALSGSEVVLTIGKGIIPEGLIDIENVVIILSAACLTLFIANLIGIPLSTSEVVVGAIVGAGLAFKAIYFDKLMYIISFWVIVPVLAFILSLVFGMLVRKLEQRFPFLLGMEKWRRPLVILLIVSGCLEAFAAGMNNVANAVGPLVGAGIIEITTAVFVGGVFVGLGAILLGGRVIETNGKKITRLSLLQGSIVSLTGGTLVIVASIFGIPMPLTQVTTSAIIGIGTVTDGILLWQKNIFKQIMMVWLVSPLFSLVMSYGLISILRKQDYYTSVVMISIFIATAGSYSLYQITRKEMRTTYGDGGGI